MSNADDFDSSQLPPLREVVEAHGLMPKKSLGQNFIFDSNVTDKIARAAGALTDKIVIEIGPGPGGLTRALLDTKASKVIAIERDSRAIEALKGLERAANGRLHIYEGDALETDLLALTEGKPFTIVANLPYNIATPLLMNWLKLIHAQGASIEKMVLMFQKEVAQRIVAPVNTKAYGRLSIMSQWLTQPHIAFDLAPTVFYPPPKVTSSVVVFSIKNQLYLNPDFATVEHVTALAFQQRRKMLRSSLKNYCNIMSNYDIPLSARAENLTVEEFLTLADNIK